jgi:hypothetical protein
MKGIESPEIVKKDSAAELLADRVASLYNAQHGA